MLWPSGAYRLWHVLVGHLVLMMQSSLQVNFGANGRDKKKIS